MSDFPEAYDLRAEGLAPEVGDQTPFNTCWAFGALGSLESNALVESAAALAGRDGALSKSDKASAGSPGYSEHHLAWFAYEIQHSGSQEGEGVTPANLGSFDPRWGGVYHMAAGSPYLALSTLASWTGAEYEDAVPYVDNRGAKEAGNENWRVDEDLRASSKNHLTDVEFLPTPVVYSKDNFVDGHRPAEDGAWIVQNSWGTGSWGLPDEQGVPSGCFYLSYYDETACEFASFQGDAVENGFEYERAYQYDYLGLSAMLVEPDYVANEASTANVFVAEEDEELAAVSAVTLRPEASVEVEVYALDEGAAAPDEGRLVSRATEAFDNSGYHTVELDESVELAAGKRFAVVETIRVPGEGGEDGEDAESAYQVYFENAPADEESSLRWAALSLLETTMRANAGESFRYDEGVGWRDVTELDAVSCVYDSAIRVEYGNALIKGFARDGER